MQYGNGRHIGFSHKRCIKRSVRCNQARLTIIAKTDPRGGSIEELIPPEYAVTFDVNG